MLGSRDQLCKAARQGVYGRIEHDLAVADEKHIGQQILDLFNLMGRDENGALMIEIVVQQGFVETSSIQEIETQCRLVQDQQLGIDRHDQRQMELCDHAFG